MRAVLRNLLWIKQGVRNRAGRGVLASLAMLACLASAAPAHALIIDTATVGTGTGSGFIPGPNLVFYSNQTSTYSDAALKSAIELAQNISLPANWANITGNVNVNAEDVTINFDVSPLKQFTYLLVKDGNQTALPDPPYAQYVFDLVGLGWNGTDSIQVNGLWPAQGSISHYAIYTAGDTIITTNEEIPEPASLVLASIGGLGAIVMGRRRRKQQIA